jgi:hypothetical protein
MSISLDQVVTCGRSRREYDLMFNLRDDELSAGVLDCGGGPASFVAELSASGIPAVAIDPLYAFSASQIASRFEAVVEPMLAQIRATPQDWTWTYHRDPDDLCANRRAALAKFLVDYDQGRRENRYIAAELPSLPFPSGSFKLALSSHLLFLYSDLLDRTFHIRSILELCRVAKEVRIFPLLTLARQPSPHLPAVQSTLQDHGWNSEIVRVDYELQRGGNQMFRIFR